MSSKIISGRESIFSNILFKAFDGYKLKVNAFYQKEWMDFKNEVEKLNLSLFKDSFF